jgi:TIR domain
MPFKYSCFISYRHGQRKLAERIINDLSEALSNELELLLDKEVYLDRERLKGGEFYNEALATALCESACMIVVFTPTYFDKEYTFCAREYKAMEKLEEARFKTVGGSTNRTPGLIIPIIFRGEDCLPKEIKESRQYYNFGDFLLSDVKIGKHPKYARKIQEIARYIYDHYKTLEALDEDPCSGCAQFRFPADAEIRQWLEGIRSYAAPFPGREGGL